MEITFSKIKKWALIYVTLPLFIFFLGFVKPIFSIPVFLVLSVALYWAITDDNVYENKNNKITISKKQLIIFFFLFLLWTYFAGFNGFYYQSGDWSCRNPIFHDLVLMDWPVVYENNSALVYYIGFWLPAAAVTKIIGLFGVSSSALWIIAKQLFWLWGAIGVYLIFLLLCIYQNAMKTKERIIVFLIFVFFSGLDILGMLTLGTGWYISGAIHIEWWSLIYQYSSITTCLFWVFNQSVIPWLVVILFLFEKSPKNFLLLGMACFASGPLPFVGLVICMLLRGIEQLIEAIKKKQVKPFLKNTFSISNILVLLTVFPILASYFLSNTSVSTGTNTGNNPLFDSFIEYIKDPIFVFFFFFEVAIYALLVWKEHKRDLMYYGIIASLVVIPYFYVGSASDFCMRASIPALFILMIYCAQMILNRIVTQNKKDLCAYILALALLVGAVTPAYEFYRGFYMVATNKTILLEDDRYDSVGDMESANNFTTSDYGNKIFFKYFSN